MKYCDSCSKEMDSQIILVDGNEAERFCSARCLLMKVLERELWYEGGIGLCYPGGPNKFWIKRLVPAEEKEKK